MSSFPKQMKPIGYTVKTQQGDWLITWEVIGYNEKTQANVWQEKHRKWNPRPQISDAIAAIDRELNYQFTKDLHKQLAEV